jgi:hypothetical protein
MSYAFLNKNVLISVLKWLRLVTVRISRGSSLKSFGAAAVKALSPRVFFVLVTFGASNSSLFDRRQYLLCSFVFIRSLSGNANSFTLWKIKWHLPFVLQTSSCCKSSWSWTLFSSFEITPYYNASCQANRSHTIKLAMDLTQSLVVLRVLLE